MSICLEVPQEMLHVLLLKWLSFVCFYYYASDQIIEVFKFHERSLKELEGTLLFSWELVDIV